MLEIKNNDIERQISIGIITINGNASLTKDDLSKIRTLFSKNTDYIDHNEGRISLSTNLDELNNLNIVLAQRDDHLDFIIDESKDDEIIMNPLHSNIKRNTLDTISPK